MGEVEFKSFVNIKLLASAPNSLIALPTIAKVVTLSLSQRGQQK